MTPQLLLARYGLAALFIGAGVEGETVVVIGGMLAHDGTINVADAIPAAAAGSFLADQLLFALGRRFRDHPRVERITKRPAFARALVELERRPNRFIFAFRFLYGLRVASPIAIGASRIPASRFVALNAAAAITWATLFTVAGYAFGHGIERALGRVRPMEHSLVVGAVLAALVTLAAWSARRALRRPAPRPRA